ncbi:hypothetical protein PGB90_001881 [Kerria lacca]
MREKKKNSMLSMAIHKISDETSERNNSLLSVQALNEGVKRRLIELMRLMRTTSGCFLNLNVDDISTVQAIDAFEKNCVFLWAAYIGRLDILQKFYDEGIDVNFTHDYENFNALHLSALSGSIECTRWLLNQGCQIIYTASGLSPLHFAAFGNSVQICHYLIENGCKVDSTVLHAAVYSNSEDCVHFLLDKKIDVNEYDETGKTVLHVVADLGNIKILELLLTDNRINLSAKTVSQHYTALHFTAENGYVNCTQALLKSGAYVDELSKYKQTPLYLACKITNVDCVELLLTYEANVNIRDYENRTPLHAAVNKSPWSLHVVRMLVERSADVNIADVFGYTALHIAALNEFEQCVEYLIMAGANVAAKTKGNISALNIINRKTPVSVKMIPRRLDLLVSLKEQNLKFNYRDLIRNSDVGEIGYLYRLQKEGQQIVLEHPLCRAFLYLKWQTIRSYILLRVILSVIMSILLSLFVLLGITQGCYNEILQKIYNGSCNETLLGQKILENPILLKIIWRLINFFLFLNTIRIFFSLAAYKSVRHYFRKYWNVLELFLTIGIILLHTKDFEGKLFSLHIPVGAATVFGCWAYLMVTISQLPFFGTHIVMFNKVLKEFLKMILAFSCLLLGFTFTFCVLDSNYFENPVVAFIKVIGMMTGELNLESITNDDNISLVYITLITVLCLFMILVTIVLMNLLVGIAVNDVEGLRKTADLGELIQQTKLIYFIELSCFHGFFPKKIITILRKFLYTSPDSYKVVMYVRPLSPHENRLPKDIMEAATNVAMTRYKKNSKEPSIEKRIELLEEQVIKLQDLITILNENLKNIPKLSINTNDTLNNINEIIENTV